MFVASHDYADKHFPRFRARLEQLLRIPSISTQVQHHSDVRSAAYWLADWMMNMGMTRADVIEREGSLPLVFGEYDGAGEDAPTVLVYTHYDVQPAEKSDGWATEPFVPTEINGKLFARGAVDSKCHVTIQLAAAETLLANGKPPVNIKLICEGEEESAGEHLVAFVSAHAERLKADYVVISDGSLPNEIQPVLEYGLRGVFSFEIVVRGPQRDLHSGHYGGSVHNPIQALCELIAQLHNADGSVNVPGFYDQVDILSRADRDLLLDMRTTFEEEWRHVANAPQPWGEPDYTLHERITIRPTLECNGIFGGYTEPGVKTVLPAMATAKISCRLVPSQDPTQVFEAVKAHIERLTPPTVSIEVIRKELGSAGFVIDPYSAPMQAVREAYLRGWGVDPKLSRDGGSIPIVADMQKHLTGAAILLMPFGYKAGGAHSINESCDLGMVQRGIHTMLHFYELITSPGAG